MIAQNRCLINQGRMRPLTLLGKSRSKMHHGMWLSSLGLAVKTISATDPSCLNDVKSMATCGSCGLQIMMHSDCACMKQDCDRKLCQCIDIASPSRSKLSILDQIPFGPAKLKKGLHRVQFDVVPWLPSLPKPSLRFDSTAAIMCLAAY